MFVDFGAVIRAGGSVVRSYKDKKSSWAPTKGSVFKRTSIFDSSHPINLKDVTPKKEIKLIGEKKTDN